MPDALKDIALELPHPADYLGMLDHALKRHYPDLPLESAEIASLLGAPPVEPAVADSREMQRVLGYGGDLVVGLIDREWHDAPDNECDELFAYLRARDVMGPFSTAFVWAAGPCRLGDYLASGDAARTVTCSDLSWPMLYYGRALIERALHRLPAVSLRDRLHYVRDEAAGTLAARWQPARFKPPLTSDPDRIRFAVRDVYCTATAIDAELVCVPYLLDVALHLTRVTTMLVRLFQQSRVGQRFVILVTCGLSRSAGDGRDPAAILETLRRSGCRIDDADLVRLPYSFLYHGYAAERTIRNTLVVRATRVDEIDPDRLGIVSHVDPDRIAHDGTWDPSRYRVAHQGRDVSLAGEDAAILRRCQETGRYREIVDAPGSGLDPRYVETIVIGDLASKGLIDLTLP